MSDIEAWSQLFAILALLCLLPMAWNIGKYVGPKIGAFICKLLNKGE